MKLFLLVSYDDWKFKAYPNIEEAEKDYKKQMGFKLDKDWNHVVEFDEIDGYEVKLIKKS